MKKQVAVFLSILLIFMAAGCKPANEDAAPTPTPTSSFAPSSGRGTSPLTKTLVQFISEKDERLGAMLMHMDEWIDANGQTALKDLPVTVQTPFAGIDGLLSDALVLSFSMAEQDDGSFRYENTSTGEKAVMSVAGQDWHYTGWAAGDGSIASQTGTVSMDGHHVTLVLTAQTESNPINALKLEGDSGSLGVRVRCMYTLDNGGSYQFLVYAYDNTTFRFSLYADVDPENPLFQGDMWTSEFFPPGAETAGSWNGESAQLINNGLSYTF